MTSILVFQTESSRSGSQIPTPMTVNTEIETFKFQKRPPQNGPFEWIKINRDRHVKDLKKWAGERAEKDWTCAANKIAEIPKEPAQYKL